MIKKMLRKYIEDTTGSVLCRTSCVYVGIFIFICSHPVVTSCVANSLSIVFACICL